MYPLIQSGDIIAITTDAEGLDYSHLGIAVKDAAGVVRLPCFVFGQAGDCF